MPRKTTPSSFSLESMAAVIEKKESKSTSDSVYYYVVDNPADKKALAFSKRNSKNYFVHAAADKKHEYRLVGSSQEVVEEFCSEFDLKITKVCSIDSLPSTIAKKNPPKAKATESESEASESEEEAKPPKKAPKSKAKASSSKTKDSESESQEDDTVAPKANSKKTKPAKKSGDAFTAAAQEALDSGESIKSLCDKIKELK